MISVYQASWVFNLLHWLLFQTEITTCQDQLPCHTQSRKMDKWTQQLFGVPPVLLPHSP